MQKADIAMVGLAVMGENLALNIESKGYTVAVYNRELDWVDRFVNGRGKGKRFIGAHDLEALTAALKKPRVVFLMVRAGAPVDELIEKLLPYMECGDVIIDGGNSHFPDTARRAAHVNTKGVLYVGAGVSGGEEGALNGPSIMPGGNQQAWPIVKPILQAISAKVGDGTPCCDWVGENGAGHFVKMVHNGIEYGDIQLICEAYSMLRSYGLDDEALSKVFADWNKTELNSYLIEITSNILAYQDEDGQPLVEKILDTAGQKGTGKWTSVAALDVGVPLTLISEAVFARDLSAMKDERLSAAALYPRVQRIAKEDYATLIEDVKAALYAAKIISYAQGFVLMREAAKNYGWSLNYGSIALMWRGGCIIRSAFLGKISEAYDRDPGLKNLLLDPYFHDEMIKLIPAWRRIVAAAVQNGIAMPAMNAALSYFDGYTTARLPANLLQAQRDYFGAHTYERVDVPRGKFFHTNWTGRGGSTSSGTYNA